MAESSNNTPSLVVGLTGGIGSGKTAVSDYFASLGVPIIDTDVISREVVAKGTPALNAVRDKFGPDVLTQDGELNRRQLRSAIFNAPELKKWLEQLLHPLIRQEVGQQLALANSDYAIVAIPLLAENWPYPYINRVLVVDVPEEVQLQRACARDSMSIEQAQAIVGQQAPRQQRLRIADDVIDNTDSIEQLHLAIRQLHQRYIDLAKLSQ
tara:strand:- start:2442 stop:3071 length:630 start_codon:yes stop_codon:yes gene_type:complete